MQLPRFTAMRGAFASRNYAIYASGNLVSTLGTWIQRVGVGWLAWELTHSGFWLGMVSFANMFPVVVVGLFAGVLADRYDRRLLLMGCQILMALQATALCVLTATGAITIELLFGLTLLGGIIISVAQPSRLSLIHGLVPPENLTAAIATNSISFNLARFIGPAIAGPIIVHLNVASAFGINAASFLVMASALSMVHLPKETTPVRTATGVLAEMGEGLRYATTHPVVAPLLALVIVIAVLLRPTFELLPGFADAVFGRGAGGLSMMTSATGFGAILGGLWVAQRMDIRSLTSAIFVGAVLSGLGVLAFAVTHQFWLALVILSAISCTVVVCGIASQTLLQHMVDGRKRGRVIGIWGIIFRGGPGLGALIMGSGSDAFGTGLGLPLIVGGLFGTAITGYMAVRYRGRVVAGQEEAAQAAAESSR